MWYRGIFLGRSRKVACLSLVMPWPPTLILSVRTIGDMALTQTGTFTHTKKTLKLCKLIWWRANNVQVKGKLGDWHRPVCCKLDVKSLYYQQSDRLLKRILYRSILKNILIVFSVLTNRMHPYTWRMSCSVRHIQTSPAVSVICSSTSSFSISTWTL